MNVLICQHKAAQLMAIANVSSSFLFSLCWLVKVSTVNVQDKKAGGMIRTRSLLFQQFSDGIKLTQRSYKEAVFVIKLGNILMSHITGCFNNA